MAAGASGIASGIACGVVRNFYFQPAMGEVMRVSFDIWESDPEAFHFHNCEYIAVVPEPQDADIEAIYARQQGEGFPSTLVQGEQKVFDHMREMFPDWKARGLTSLLQEHRGGFAFNKDAINGLADKARSEGVTIYDGVQVTGFKHGSDNSVTHVETTDGDIEVGCVVSGAGPWSARVWEMLGLSDRVDVRDRDGEMHPNQPLWTYWRLEEGEITFDPSDYATAEGKMPPVFHFDSRETLISDKTGDVLSSADDLWGVYWKSDREGVQGGAEPIHLGEKVNLDPYGPDSPEHGARGLCRILDIGPGPRPWAVRRILSQVFACSYGRRRVFHFRQLSDFRLCTGRSQCLRDRRQQPRFQNDRRGKGSGESARRRKQRGSRSVPFCTVRGG